MEDILIDITDFIDDESIKEEYYEIIKDCYNNIYSKPITPSNITIYIVYLMKFMETYSEVSNIDKKKFLIFILKKFVEFNISDKEEIKIFNSFIDNILPNMIDTMISVDNKEIIIKNKNYNNNLFKKIFKCFCCE